MRESLLRRLRNALVKPTKHAAYLRLRALRHRAQPLAAQLAAVEAATPASLSAHAAALLAHCAVDALVMGNVTASEAAQLCADAAAVLPPGAGVPSASWPRERVLRVPPTGALLFATGRNAADDNSVAESYFQIGTHAAPSTRERACADLASQLLGEPCFDALRTKEQLGYTVASGVRLTHGVLGFAVTVQSAKHGPAHLDARIDAFLASYEDALRAMPSDEFERNRAAVVSSKLQKERSLCDEAEKHWDAIWHRHADWARREREAACLSGISQEEMCAWYAAHLAPGQGRQRRKLGVRVACAARAEEERAAAAADAAAAGALFAEEEAGVEALRGAWGFFEPAPVDLL